MTELGSQDEQTESYTLYAIFLPTHVELHGIWRVTWHRTQAIAVPGQGKSALLAWSLADGWCVIDICSRIVLVITASKGCFLS